MHLAFDIFQGIGVAAAVGIRPFLPALAVGALAAGEVQIDFKGTDYAFLESWPFLLAMAVAAVALALLERRRVAGPDRAWPMLAVLAVVALGLAAVLFAGALAQDRYTSWPGLAGGVICAGLALVSIRPLLGRVASHLGTGDAAVLPVYAEILALAVAVLSVVAPPLGILAGLLLVWLLIAGRRREGEKYAGLRILR